MNKRQSQLENAHSMLMRHHEQTHELESKQQRSVHHIREDHINRQHSTELTNQEEYMRRAQRELKKKHGLEIKQQPKSLKQKELMIRKQFRDTCKIQTRQYKALKAQVLQTTSKEEQKTIIRKLKEEQRRKMALLGEQYEQTIADMLQKQSVSFLVHLRCEYQVQGYIYIMVLFDRKILVNFCLVLSEFLTWSFLYKNF